MAPPSHHARPSRPPSSSVWHATAPLEPRTVRTRSPRSRLMPYLWGMFWWLLAHADQAVGSERCASGAPEEVGRQLYLAGQDCAGEPLRGKVAGDIVVEGPSFACVNCHLRSGLGMTEGSIPVRPISATRLFQPLYQAAPENRVEDLPAVFQPPLLRPAYDDALLLRALREGRDPTGRLLHPLMPRFELREAHAQGLLATLRALSAKPSAGLEDGILHLATVIGPEVTPSAAQALVDTLEAFVIDHNVESRSERQRSQSGAFFMRAMSASFRPWKLHVWRLEGAPSSWQAQLEQRYQRRPVFVVLSGLVEGSWRPLHTWAEQASVPVLLPFTHLPAEDPGWYTLYFSGGYAQEGARVMRWLQRPLSKPASGWKRLWKSWFFTRHSLEEGLPPPPRPFLQIEGEGLEEQALAQGAWQQRLALPGGQGRLTGAQRMRHVSADETARRIRQLPPGQPVLLWVSQQEARKVLELLGARVRWHPLVLSGRLWKATAKPQEGRLEQTFSAELPSLEGIPLPMRPWLVWTWPQLLPERASSRVRALSGWLETRRLSTEGWQVRAQALFAGRLLNAALKGMRENFYSDHLLERIDMMADDVYTVATVPRVSFGPGQRQAAKGVYLLSWKTSPSHGHAEAHGHAGELVPLPGTDWSWSE